MKPPSLKPQLLVRLRPAKINFYLRFMRQKGFASAQVLEGTGLTPEILGSAHELIEVSKYTRVISNIHRLCREPALAFELGAALTLGDLGILGYCVMSCADTDEATRLWHEYNPVFFGNLIEVVFEKAGNQLRLTHVPLPGIREDLLQFLIEEKLCYDMALQRLVGLDRFPLESLTLTYKKPGHAERYAELMRCRIAFSAPRNTMLLLDNAMALPLHGQDAETHQHCLKLLNSVYTSITAGSLMSHRVRAILQERTHANPGIAEIAGALHYTPRTLNRILAKEGQNFQKLSIAIRLEAIQDMLATTNLGAKEVALRMGFSDVRSLRRFFKAQTGDTLAVFRNDQEVLF
jgi:AraC-like DNA-binding protein